MVRKREIYHNSKAEQKFNEYFGEFKKMKLTKRGYPDFMLVDNHNKCIGFVEVKRSKKQKLKPEQIVFKEFCREHNIFWYLWTPDW